MRASSCPNLVVQIAAMRWYQRGWLVVLLACVQVHGCSSSGPYLSPAVSQAMTTIKIGMTREEVVSLLGPPLKQQVFGKTELLTYQPDWTLGKASEFNPIGIEAGRVTGFGLTYATKVEVEYKLGKK